MTKKLTEDLRAEIAFGKALITLAGTVADLDRLGYKVSVGNKFEKMQTTLKAEITKCLDMSDEVKKGGENITVINTTTTKGKAQ